MACCPAHDDRKQSLHVTAGDKGGIVLNCFTGCDTGEILSKAGLTIQDIMPERETPVKSGFDFHNVVSTYNYPNGTRKLRDRNKNFLWQHQGPSGEWASGRGDAAHVLYQAGTAQGKVYLVEGEKDADNVGRLGLYAVSSENGAGKGGKKWYPEYSTELAGLGVVIIPDNDAVGREYMDTVAGEISRTAKSVKLLDVKRIMPDLPDKGDISDVIQRLGPEATLSKLAEVEASTDPWVPFTMSEPDVFSQFGFYTVPDLTEEDRRPPEFIVDGMIPVGMSILAGAPKTRKSFLALQLAIAVATGNRFLGRDTVKCDVVYFDLEGSKSRIYNRSGRMSISIPKNVYVTNVTKDKLADGKLVKALRELHHQRPEIRLIIIDTLSRSRGRVKSTGGANAYDADVELLEPVQRMAIEENISLLFVHHHKKGASFMSDSFEQMSGTMGISGSADCVLNLTTEGKRFDGRATLEYTPRDAVGGELPMMFDSFRLEWLPDYTSPSDLSGNPVCKWIIDNAPEPKKDAKFFPYETVYTQAYRAWVEDPGNIVKKQVETYQDDLFREERIAVQTSVPVNGKRGIRVMRTQ